MHAYFSSKQLYFFILLGEIKRMSKVIRERNSGTWLHITFSNYYLNWRWKDYLDHVSPERRERLIEKGSGYSWMNRYFRKDTRSNSEPPDRVVQKHKTRIVQNQTGLDLTKEMEIKDFTERVFPCLKGKQERKKWVQNKSEVKIYSDWNRTSKQNK